MPNSDIQVLWFSKVHLAPGMRIIPHSHDYFHFSCPLSGHIKRDDGSRPPTPRISCHAPGVVHGGWYYPEDCQSFNIMFLVPDKTLYKTIEHFPFEDAPLNRAHIPLLCDIAGQIETLNPEPSFVNAAVSYYLQLVLSDNRELLEQMPNQELAAKCMTYINEHYAGAILLDDIAAYIGRSRNYTSTLFSEAYGMTLIEYANKVRIQHACSLIAYSDIPIEEVPLQCGFNSVRNFNRVFMSIIGTTPARYRTSHRQKDLQFTGDSETLKSFCPPESFFTYVVNARKKVNWASEYDYLMQFPPEGGSE